MSASPADLHIILDKRPWRVWKGVGSFLLFDFGRPRRNQDGTTRGTYTLWISMAEWRIVKARRELAHSESHDRIIHRAAEALTDKKLEAIILKTSVAKRQPRHGVSLHFEGGYLLHAWAYERGKRGDDIFYLYLPKRCILYHRDGALSAESLDAK